MSGENDNLTQSDMLTRVGRQLVPLLSGSGLGQILLFLAYPIISRLYSTDDFGVLAAFTAISMPFTVIASLKYELAMPTARSERQFQALGLACFWISGIVSLFCLALLGLFGSLGWTTEVIQENLGYMMLIPAAVLAGGTMRWLNYWFVGRENFNVIAIGSAGHAAAMAGSQILGGLFILGPLGLVGSQVAAPLLATAIMVLIARPRTFTLFAATRRDVAESLKRFRSFSIFGAPHAFLNAASLHFPSFLLASLLGLGPAGIFLMATRILRHPADLTGEALRQAIFPELVRAAERGALAHALRRTIAILAVVTVPAILLGIFYGPELFAFVLGEQWRESGILAGYLIISIAAEFTSVPATVAVQILEIQRIHLRYEIVLLVLRIIAIAAGAQAGGLELAALLYSLSGTAVALSLIASVYLRSRSSDATRAKDASAESAQDSANES